MIHTDEAMIKIVECPRDAMQGLEQFIPTSVKANYLNDLLKVGFHTLDFGSFVSPKAIPQMRDTAEVLEGLDLSNTNTRLLAIIANLRGAESALVHEEIDFLGYPLSISETFQQRNTNRSISEALENLLGIQDRVQARNKTLVVYLSMGFGNPYGDPYSADLVEEFTSNLVAMGVEIISLSDTVGTASANEVGNLFRHIQGAYPLLEVGVHLHATPQDARSKIAAALDAGCKRFDGAIRGFGGCPMAKDDLVGNLPTEVILELLDERNIDHGLSADAFAHAMESSASVF